MEEILHESGVEAESESRSASREPSPGAGEGQPPDERSLNGLSGGSADRAHQERDGGMRQELQGVSLGAGNQVRANALMTDEEELPSYSSGLPRDHTTILNPSIEEDEGFVDAVASPHVPWNDATWDMKNIPTVPPGSENNFDEDLFADVAKDDSSTKAEGDEASSRGQMSDVGGISDGDEDMAQPPAILRSSRASAPPRQLMETDEEDDLPVVEIRPPGEE